jgi:hypothetical protein
MTAAFCARVYFTQKSSYARVRLRMGFATDKNIFLTKDSFCEKKCKETGKNMLIRRKMSTWLSFSKSGGSLFPFETLFFFLKQIPVTGSCKNYQNEKKTCTDLFTGFFFRPKFRQVSGQACKNRKQDLLQVFGQDRMPRPAVPLAKHFSSWSIERLLLLHELTPWKLWNDE